MPSPSVPVRFGESYVKEVLGAAITCRLYASGWTPPWEPGNRALRRGVVEFDPYATIVAISNGEISQEDWQRQITELGLFPSMSLSKLSTQEDLQ